MRKLRMVRACQTTTATRAKTTVAPRIATSRREDFMVSVDNTEIAPKDQIASDAVSFLQPKLRTSKLPTHCPPHRKLACNEAGRSYTPMLAWIRTRRRTILADQWICLHADECQLPTGALIEPYYVLEEKEWVHVIALNQNDEILLIRQYRYAANICATELPGGFVDPGESPLDAAKRELAAETGHTSLDWTPLPASSVNPAR